MTNLISEAMNAIKNWWLFLLLGIVMLIGGIWVLRTPMAGYVALSAIFIALLLVNGITQIFFSISNKDRIQGWGWYLAGGILEFMIGIYLWSYPAMSMAILPMVVGFWLMFRGISVIASSTEMKNMGAKGWGWTLTFGILLTIIAFFMVMDPVFGAFNLIYLTAFALIFMGIAYITLSFRMKQIKTRLSDMKGDVNELKQKVMGHLQDAPEEMRENVEKMFDEYKEKE